MAGQIIMNGTRILLNIRDVHGQLTMQSNVARKTEDAIGNIQYNAAADGIEAFILALACQGMNVQRPEFSTALTAVLEACGNNYDDASPLTTERP